MKLSTTTLPNKAKQHKGFGNPRLWLQVLFHDDSEQWLGFNDTRNNVQGHALHLMRDKGIERILMIDGNADLQEIISDDILADYMRHDSGKGDQKLIYLSA